MKRQDYSGDSVELLQALEEGVAWCKLGFRNRSGEGP